MNRIDDLSRPPEYDSVLNDAAFRLLTACAYYTPENWPEQRKYVEAALAEMPDADKFHNLVGRHRLQVLTHTVLTRVANETQSSLSHLMPSLESVKRIRMQNLFLHTELQRLQTLFKDAQIAMLPLKGSLLSVKLYGDPCMRQMRDIDIVVFPNDLPKALTLLEQAGYCAEPLPARQRIDFKLVRAGWWHIECRHPKNNILVELHWRVEPAPITALENQWQKWMHESDPMQCQSYELLYLCLHGADHRWNRLKWLGDIQVLIARMKDDDWTPLIALAKNLRMENILAQTLILLHWLLGCKLVGQARSFALSYREQAVLDAQSVLPVVLDLNEGTMISTDFMARRYSRWERLLHWLNRYALRQGDMRVLPLPIFLIWMYPLLRPFSLLVRRVFYVGTSSSIVEVIKKG